jgi:hypothetical protein
MRKTLSLSTLFRTERAARSRTSSEAMDEGRGTYDSAVVKKIRRISLRRSPASTNSILNSSPGGSPHSTCSSSYTQSSNSRISRMTCRSLFADNLPLEEEDFVPPQRPACPAPLLDLSFEGLSLHDDLDAFHISHTTRLHSVIMGRLSVLCPSEESFYCRGLEEEAKTAATKALPRNRNRRPTMTAIVAPSALKLRPQSSFLSMDSDTSSPTSSMYSFETTPEALDTPHQSSFPRHQPPLIRSPVLGVLCPASPPPRVRLQLTLPPTANLTRRLTLQVDSNASTLELKETLCSTLLQQFNFSISPSGIALSFVYEDGEPPRLLENSRPLYQEGLQDDDDIIVRF